MRPPIPAAFALARLVLDHRRACPAWDGPHAPPSLTPPRPQVLHEPFKSVPKEGHVAGDLSGPAEEGILLEMGNTQSTALSFPIYGVG